jgi:hypothetical protein
MITPLNRNVVASEFETANETPAEWSAGGMRLFLNVRNPSGDVSIDPDGQEFDTLHEAEAEARATARDLMADALRSALPVGLDRVMEVADETGKIVARVVFETAIIR